MKKLISLYIAALFCLLTVASCNKDKFFEVKRPQEPQWVSTVTFDQGLAAVYYNMLYALQAGPQMMDYAESGISQLLPGTTTGAPYNEMYNRLFTQNHNQTNDMWTGCYAAITLSNEAIALDKDGNGNAFNLAVSSTDYKDNYTRQVGEYFFARAYAYYLLVRHFAQPYVKGGDNSKAYIPFKTVVPTSREEVLAEKLGSNEEIYSQMIADLRVAKEKLPLAYNSASMLPTYITGRATQYSAAALLAKILFLKGEYEAAKTELDFVIGAAETTGRFALEGPIEAFNKNVVANIPKESILEFNTGDPAVSAASRYMYWGWVISLQDRDADNFGRGPAPGMSKSTVSQFTLSYWALDKIGWMTNPLAGDYTLTQAAKDDLRFQQLYYYLLPYKAGAAPAEYFTHETLIEHAAVNKPQLYVDKYFRGGPGDGRYTKFPLIRLADMYLIRGWLRWKTGNLNGSAGDMNKVWNRSNPTHPDKYNTGNLSHDAIFAEYVREMSGEGYTLDFMVATGMPIPAGDRAGVPEVPSPYTGWKWEVPAAEKALNPNYH